MANQEVGGPGIFGISTPTRERTAISVITEPKTRPAPVFPEPEKPPKTKKFLIQRLARAIGAIAIFGGGGLAIQHHVQNQEDISPRGIVRDIGAIPITFGEDFNWLLQKFGLKVFAENVPDYFDPDAKKGTIEEGVNRITVSQDVLESAYEKKVAENKDSGHPAVIFPVKLIPGQRFNYEYKEPVTSGVDSVTGEPITHDASGAFRMNLDKGESIIAPVKNAQIFKRTAVINGQRYLVSIYAKFEQNGREFAFAFASGDGRKLIPQNGVMDAPDLPTTNNWRNDAQNGLILPLGMEIVTSSLDSNLPDNANFSTKNPETGRWESVKPDYIMDASPTKLIGP